MGAWIDRAAVRRALLLTAAASGLGLAQNAVRSDGVPILAFAPPTECDAQLAPIPELAPAEATHLCARPGVAIADARPASRFAEGHVAGATHLPCGGSAAAEAAIARLGAASAVLVYGDSTEEGRAVAEGIRRRRPEVELYVLRGGFSAWEREGFACSSGACADCDARGATP